MAQRHRAAGPGAAAGPAASRVTRLAQPARSPRPTQAATLARFALLAALLAAVFAGIHAAGPSILLTGPWRKHILPFGAALEGVLAALLIAVQVRSHRTPDPGQPAAGLRTTLRVVLGTGLIAIPVLMLFTLVGDLHVRSRRQQPPTKTKPVRPRLPQHQAAAASNIDLGRWLLYALIAAVLAAAIITCIVLLRRRAPAGPGADEAEDLGEDAEELRRALESGRSALREVDDARAAIIACYAAMEQAMADAGAARAAAETPDELLVRAAAAGLVRGAAAERLTALFYEARFSSHPLARHARDTARQALDELLRLLRSPQSAGAAP
jgi:cytochrome b